jgi:hypothetical protein
MKYQLFKIIAWETKSHLASTWSIVVANERHRQDNVKLRQQWRDNNGYIKRGLTP